MATFQLLNSRRVRRVLRDDGLVMRRGLAA